jgi:hypothetical protein
LKAANSNSSQIRSAILKIVETKTLPALQQRDKASETSAAPASPTLTIRPGADGKVERIVIAGSSPGNSQAESPTQANAIGSTIKIRTASDEVERLPVKAFDSKK